MNLLIPIFKTHLVLQGIIQMTKVEILPMVNLKLIFNQDLPQEYFVIA